MYAAAFMIISNRLLNSYLSTHMAEKTSAFYRTEFIVDFTFAIPGIRYVVIGRYNYQSGRLLRSFSLVTLNIGKGCCNVTELLRARRYARFAIIYRLSTTASVDMKHRGFFSVKLLHYIIEKVVRKADRMREETIREYKKA